MAQINLLKQTGNSSDIWGIVPKMLVWFFFLLLALLLVYYIWLFINIGQIGKKITETQNKINVAKQTALNVKNRNELFTRQLQLQDLNGLVSKHIYWSQMMPELARVTLKISDYKSLKATVAGDLTLSVIVPALSDLEKYMQIFDLPEFNQNFSNIRIGGFSKIQQKTSTYIQFVVKMDYDTDLIQYHEQTQ